MASNQSSADRAKAFGTPKPAKPKEDPGRKYLEDLAKARNAPDTSGLTGVSAAAAQYPAFATMMAIPDVADLLNQAANAGWTPDQFTLHLMATNWWKSTSDSGREWQQVKLSDPAKAARLKQQAYNNVATEASLLGVPLSTQQIDYIAEGSIGGGWTPDQTKAAIAGNAQFGKDRAGTITATQTALGGVAASYGIPVSSHTTFDWAKKIASGTADQQGFTEYAKDQAKISHPYWVKQLDQGLTVRQLADPYVQQAARTLEVAPDSIDLTNPKWNFVQKDHTGQAVPMSQSDWQTHLMNDARFGWDHTQNAKDGAYGVVDSLRQEFGAA